MHPRLRLVVGILAGLAAGAALAACGGENPPLTPEAAVPRRDFLPRRDLLPRFDVYLPPPGDGRADGKRDGKPVCTLGTASNCKTCGDVCPPGKDTATTARVCLAGACSIQCQDEAYDVNGKVDDGCEAEDDLPVHDTALDAVNLGEASDCSGVLTASGALPSDDRLHFKAPTDRAQGRADWFKLHVTDDAGCVVEGTVEVSLAKLPAAALYRAVAYWVCDGGKQLDPDAKAANGGQTISLIPPAVCTLLGNDSGTLFLKITKESGPHSAATYGVQIQP